MATDDEWDEETERAHRNLWLWAVTMITSDGRLVALAPKVAAERIRRYRAGESPEQIDLDLSPNPC